MCLKPSRSKNSTATFFMWRGADVIAWLTRSFSKIRLGRAVRKSCWAVWVICSVMACATLTSRKTMTAPVACPSRSWMGETESSIGISNPSRRMRRQFNGKCTVRSCSTALSIGFGMVSWLVESTIWRTSAIARPTASWEDQPVIFSATRLRKLIFPTMSVQMTASPMELSVTWARSFSTNNASSMILRSTA